jgi:hypothetical protein
MPLGLNGPGPPPPRTIRAEVQTLDFKAAGLRSDLGEYRNRGQPQETRQPGGTADTQAQHAGGDLDGEWVIQPE